MNEKILPNSILQTFFISREVSNCPLISEMIKLGKRLEEIGLADTDAGIISHNYGKRLLINAKNIDVKNMKQQDIVEIVDYDPLKNVMMVIGTKDPCVETPVHWIVQKARHDINALLQIHSQTLFEKLKGTLPSTENEFQPNTIDFAKELLKALRIQKTILIKNQGIFFGGVNIAEIHNTFCSIFGVQK